MEKHLLVFNTRTEAAFGLILWRAGTDALQRGSHQPLPCSCQLSLVLAAYQDFSSSLPPAVIYESRLEESGVSSLHRGVAKWRCNLAAVTEGCEQQNKRIRGAKEGNLPPKTWS